MDVDGGRTCRAEADGTAKAIQAALAGLDVQAEPISAPDAGLPHVTSSS